MMMEAAESVEAIQNDGSSSQGDDWLMLSALRRKAFNLYNHAPLPVKSAMSFVCRAFPRSFLYGGLFRSTLKTIKETEYQSHSDLQAFRNAQLSEILLHAHRSVPFYGDDMRSKGITEEMILLAPEEALKAMGFIEKSTIMEKPDRFMSGSRLVPKDYCSTGGTYGEPLYFYIDSTRSSKEWAFFADMWGRVGYNLNSKRATFRGSRIRGGLWEDDLLTGERKFSSFELTDQYLEAIWPALLKLEPDFIYAYPSTALTLCQFVESSGKRFPGSLKAMLVGSENIYDGQREYMEQVSGRRAFSWYGHSEKLVLAGECEKSTALHAYPQYGYVEFMNEKDEPARPGEFAEIVGTGFFNTAMPFIRYRTGDFCTYLGEYCPECGRRYPVFENVRGRWTQEVLYGAKGNQICMSAVNAHSNNFTRVFRYQFYQDEPGKAILRIVPREGFSDADKAAVEWEFNSKFGPNLRVVAELVKSIPLTSRGKFRFVDQRIEKKTPNSDYQ